MTDRAIGSGHARSGHILPSRNDATVAQGGSAVPIGPAENLLSGGVFLYSGSALISSGAILTGILVGPNETEYVNGGLAVSTTVAAGGQQFVQSGGVASLTILERGSAGGTPGPLETVQAGGLDISAFIGSGAEQFLGSGGSVSDFAVIGNGGTQELSTYSATASGTTVKSGGTQLVINGTAMGTVVQSGGLLSARGTTAAVTLSGGMETISGGHASSTTILAGGTLTVGLFSESTNTLVVSGGTENVDYAALAGTTAILAGGVQVVGAGGPGQGGFGDKIGHAVDTIVSGGGVQIVAGGFNGFSFAGGDASGTVVLSGGEQLISGGHASGTVLSAGGTIDLGGFAYASGANAQLNAATDDLTVNAGGQTYDLQLGGAYTGEYFHATADGTGGTDITLDGTPCYCRGTLIATDGGEVAVEDLRIGNRLRTLSGALRPLRWIGRRSYAAQFAAGNPAILPVCFQAGALGAGLPRRNLLVSPLHAVLLDGLLIPAWLLVNGASVTQQPIEQQIDYFHLELDSHDVILAEGAPAETYLDDANRGMFHNAAEYAQLYPPAPTPAAVYCAPRVEQGDRLEAIRRRLSGAPPPVSRGRLRGNLDVAEHSRLAGWVSDAGAGPVRLCVSANGVPLAEIVADGHRGDVAETVGVNARCGFDWWIPGGLAIDHRHRIRLQRIDDGRDLPGSPCVLSPPRPLLRGAAPALRGQIDRADHHQLLGWADDSEGPVVLIVLVNGRRRGRVLANRWRADVAAAGIGQGRRAFVFPFDPPLSPRRAHRLELRRERDGAVLSGAFTIPAGGFDALHQALGVVANHMIDPGARRQAAIRLRALADGIERQV